MPVIHWNPDPAYSAPHGIATVDVSDEYGAKQPTLERMHRARQIIAAYTPPDEGLGVWCGMGGDRGDGLTFRFAFRPSPELVMPEPEVVEKPLRLPVTVVIEE